MQQVSHRFSTHLTNARSDGQKTNLAICCCTDYSQPSGAKLTEGNTAHFGRVDLNYISNLEGVHLHHSHRPALVGYGTECLALFIVEAAACRMVAWHVHTRDRR